MGKLSCHFITIHCKISHSCSFK